MTQHRQVKICWNPSTSVTNQNNTTLVNIFTCFWLCIVFCRCSYNCSQGFTLPGWLKNKPALRQVCKKYNNPMMRRWELKTTLMIRIFDVSCDEDTGEMKQGDNAMRCLSCLWIYILHFLHIDNHITKVTLNALIILFCLCPVTSLKICWQKLKNTLLQ